MAHSASGFYRSSVGIGARPRTTCGSPKPSGRWETPFRIYRFEVIYKLATQPPATREYILQTGCSEAQISAEIKIAIKKRAKAKKAKRKRAYGKKTPEQLEQELLSREREEQAAANEAVHLLCELGGHAPEKIGALRDLINRSVFRFLDTLNALEIAALPLRQHGGK